MIQVSSDTGTIATGSGFVFTGYQPAPDVEQVRLSGAGERPHGIAPDDITTNTGAAVDVTAALLGCTGPVDVLVSGAISGAGIELATDADGEFKVRGATDRAAGVSLAASSMDVVRAVMYAEAPRVPAGMISAYGGSSAPAGWLLCDGSAVSRTTYAALFAAISTAYGTGDGSTTFNIPDLRQRFPLGKATSGTGATLGGTGGAIDHDHDSPLTTGAPSATIAATNLLTTAASPTHTHSVTVPSANPPFQTVNFIVKT